MHKLTDLRFVIGLFFLATGILLTGYYFLTGKSEAEYPQINLYCGLGFAAFGIFMVWMSARGNQNTEQ